MHKDTKNAICIFIGPTGGGKSMSALRLAELVQPDFDPETQVCFDAKSFISIIQSDKLRRGDCVLFDEIGNSEAMGARSFMSSQNIALGSILQTMRFRGYVIFLTLPALSMLDKQARELAHFLFEVKGINREKQFVKCKVYRLQTNSYSGKLYIHLPRIKDPNNKITVPTSVSYMKVHKPSRKTIEIYERKKREFVSSLYQRISNGISKTEEKKQIKPTSQELAQRYLSEFPETVETVEGRRCVSKSLIAGKLGIGSRVADQVRALIEYDLNPKKPTKGASANA